jgi:polyhydroxyalkanoate synthesis regulator phasin
MVATTAASAAEQLQALMDKQAPASKIHDDASFETVDKMRADATQNLAKWESRVKAKTQQVKESLAITVSGAHNAISALEAQIEALHDKHDHYAEQWISANNIVRKRMQIRVSMLEEKCLIAKPVIPISHGRGGTLGPEVVQLQDALAGAQKLLLEQKEIMAAAELRYQQMETRLATFLPQTPVASPAVVETTSSPTSAGTEVVGQLTPAEKAERIALRESKAGGDGKGKGKGSDSSSSPSPGLDY